MRALLLSVMIATCNTTDETETCPFATSYGTADLVDGTWDIFSDMAFYDGELYDGVFLHVSIFDSGGVEEGGYDIVESTCSLCASVALYYGEGWGTDVPAKTGGLVQITEVGGDYIHGSILSATFDDGDCTSEIGTLSF